MLGTGNTGAASFRSVLFTAASSAPSLVRSCFPARRCLCAVRSGRSVRDVHLVLAVVFLLLLLVVVALLDAVRGERDGLADAMKGNGRERRRVMR